ncbi:MAG: hypothetical protein LBS62_11285 [Clostridiales bacterium]|jgi:hypothetical protein|nr:hypothetical protein [Clostridiales bacterium]
MKYLHFWNFRRLTVITLLAACLAASIQTGAATVQPGSAEDPVVSKSYVDEQINRLAQLINTAPPDTVPSPAPAQSPALPAPAFTPVEAAEGQIVIGHEGTEIILRSGSALGYAGGSSSEANGLVDMTDGTEISHGDIIFTNHLIIVPRYDGRGVRATTNAWFIIRGGYELH